MGLAAILDDIEDDGYEDFLGAVFTFRKVWFFFHDVRDHPSERRERNVLGKTNDGCQGRVARLGRGGVRLVEGLRGLTTLVTLAAGAMGSLCCTSFQTKEVPSGRLSDIITLF